MRVPQLQDSWFLFSEGFPMTTEQVISTEAPAKNKWIAKTRERAKVMLEAAERVESGEDVVDVVLMNGRQAKAYWGGDCFPEWQPVNEYTIKPKRIFRPWTAREWGSRIGDEVLAEKCGTILRYKVETVNTSFVQFQRSDGSNHWYSYKFDDPPKWVTQLDGSPCGEWSEPNA